MRVAIYIRVSTKMQEDKYSIKSQYDELTKYANSMNWKIIDYYEDVDSGSKLDKKGLERMLDDVDDGKIDVVLCIEQDRLSRLDTIKWEYLKDVLRSNGAKIAEPGRLTDLDNEDDEFMSDLRNLFAQRERKQIVRRMMRGKRQATREGKVWGKQPLGYKQDPVTRNPVIDDNTAWIVKYIDEAFLERGLVINQIVKELNEICKTPNGKMWSNHSVNKILKRPAYHGDFIRTFKGTGEVIKTESTYPPLRTKEEYNEILRILKSRFRRKPPTPHMLRGVNFKCKACEKSLTIKKGGSTNNGVQYITYIISHSVHNPNCDLNISHHRITYNLIDAIKDILTDDTSINKYLQSNFDADELVSLEKEIKELESIIKKNHEKNDRLLDLYVDGIFSKSELDKKRNEINSVIEFTARSIQEKKIKHDLIKKMEINQNTVVEYLSLASKFDSLLDVKDQQRLIGSLFPAATIDNKNNKATFHALLPQGVTMDITIDILTIDELEERKLYERSKKRHIEVQEFLNKNKGITLNRLSELLKINHRTLQDDIKRFGKWKHLGLSRSEIKQQNIRIILNMRKDDPTLTGREIERRTGINRKLVYETIKQEKSL